MAMRIRVPGWLRSAPTVKINGKAIETSAEPGSYVTVARRWNAGDTIEMALPMHLHIEAMPDDPHLQAILYGPLVLAGNLGSHGLTEAHIVGPNMRVGAANTEQSGSPLSANNTTPPIPEIEIPTLRAANADPSVWIKPGDKPNVFHTIDQRTNVTLAPLHTLFDTRYVVYWQFT
jgi:hypothetical protein